MRKSSGPRAEPYGTPYPLKAFFEEKLLTVNCCVLLPCT